MQEPVELLREQPPPHTLGKDVAMLQWRERMLEERRLAKGYAEAMSMRAKRAFQRSSAGKISK